MKMREILFHGKRADSGEWVEGDLLQTRYHSGHIEYQIMPQTPVSSAYPVLSETVGQYTGLTDKNGKRIFEGDVVKAFTRYDTPHTNAITYRNGTFWFGNWNWIEFLDRFRYAEIIGNIHDNPKLLEKESEENA